MLDWDLSFINSDDREWKINQLLFADDMPLIVDLKEKWFQLIEELGRVFRGRNLSDLRIRVK